MSSIIPHLPTCLFPCSYDINSGVKGRLRVVIRVEYKSVTSFYDSATTFVGGGGSLFSTSGQKLPRKK